MVINWQKIFQLIKRTGDRCLVVDEKSGEMFVVMDLPNYEKLIFGRSAVKDLTEEQLLDKINRDVAVWQANQEDPEDWDDFGQDDIDIAGSDVDSEEEEEERYYIEETE
ncbi:MAG: hypothetical protein V1763_01170 [Parcubacteria group bacterium]